MGKDLTAELHNLTVAEGGYVKVKAGVARELQADKDRLDAMILRGEGYSDLHSGGVSQVQVAKQLGAAHCTKTQRNYLEVYANGDVLKANLDGNSVPTLRGALRFLADYNLTDAERKALKAEKEAKAKALKEAKEVIDVPVVDDAEVKELRAQVKALKAAATKTAPQLKEVKALKADKERLLKQVAKLETALYNKKLRPHNYDKEGTVVQGKPHCKELDVSDNFALGTLKPKAKGNCVPRAIAYATKTRYDDVFNYLARDSFEEGNTKSLEGYGYGTYSSNYEPLLDDLGFTRRSRPSGKLTIQAFTQAYPKGRFVVSTSGHLQAIVDGKVVDNGSEHRGNGRVKSFYYRPQDTPEGFKRGKDYTTLALF